MLKSDPLLCPAIARVENNGRSPIPAGRNAAAGRTAVDCRGGKLLLAALAAAPIADFDLERISDRPALRVSRGGPRRNGGAGTIEMLPLACALAQQCFINGYVLPKSDDETTRLRELQNAAVGSIAGAAKQPSPMRPCGFCHAIVPLQTLPFAGALCTRSGVRIGKGIVREAIARAGGRARLAGRNIARSCNRTERTRSLAALERVSPSPPQPRSIEAHLRNNIAAGSDRSARQGAAALDILVADCGSGQAAIETAQRHPYARILAVDRSDRSTSPLANGKRSAALISQYHLDAERKRSATPSM